MIQRSHKKLLRASENSNRYSNMLMFYLWLTKTKETTLKKLNPFSFLHPFLYYSHTITYFILRCSHGPTERACNNTQSEVYLCNLGACVSNVSFVCKWYEPLLFSHPYFYFNYFLYYFLFVEGMGVGGLLDNYCIFNASVEVLLTRANGVSSEWFISKLHKAQVFLSFPFQ